MSSIFCRRLLCHFCSLCSHLPPPTPLSSSQIPRVCCRALANSVVFYNPSDASSIPRPLPTPTSLSLIPWARLTLPMPWSLLSIPQARKHTAASVVGDVHLDALSFMLPLKTPLLSSLRRRAHLPLPKPPLLSPIPQAHHRDAAASIVVPESTPPPSLYPIPRMRCLFLFLHRRLHCRRQFRGPVSETLLTFGLLTLYFF